MKRLFRSRFAPAIALALLAVWPHRGTAQALQFYNLTPCRAVDTRTGFGGIVYASIFRPFQMKGVCGVPSDAKTVTLNVTVVGPTDAGFVVLWPYNTPLPPVANVNINAGEPAIGNGAVVPLTASIPDLWLAYGTGWGGGSTHVILDVTGYFK